MLNNETTYSNGESQFFSKYPLMHNQNFHSNKNVLLVVIIEIGSCIIDFERDGKSPKSMLILESLT
jgi:hypothetical protein